MAPKILILAGAPENSTLNWESDELLIDFLEPVARFAGKYKSQEPNSFNAADESVLDTAVWRSIPLQRTILRTGFSQTHEFDESYERDKNFFDTADTQGTDSNSQSLRDEFYQHSMKVHDIPSSQIPSDSFSTILSSLDTTNQESFEDSVGDSTFLAEGNRTLGLGSAHLSDLEDIPKASYLRSIHPQTMTVNLIVGIISIAQPRAVRTRWGSSKFLVELLVGDETKSGFSITFWLSHAPGSKSGIEATLTALRRQDIVLLQNVALSEFKDKVHGHSLRKDLTKIDLLYRRKLDENDIGGLYSAKQLACRSGIKPQLLKTQRVREWVLKFVGGGTLLGKRKERGEAMRSWELPPADTQ